MSAALVSKVLRPVIVEVLLKSDARIFASGDIAAIGEHNPTSSTILNNSSIGNVSLDGLAVLDIMVQLSTEDTVAMVHLLLVPISARAVLTVLLTVEQPILLVLILRGLDDLLRLLLLEHQEILLEHRVHGLEKSGVDGQSGSHRSSGHC